MKRLVVGVATLVLLGGAAVYGGVQFAAFRAVQDGPSAVETVAFDAAGSTARIVFRNTAPGAGYGHVASVPVADTAGARSVFPVACDRVDATPGAGLCLSIDRGVVTTFTATLLDEDWQPIQSWPLPGMPSRTRFSPDGQAVAFSAFITGESYATVDFSIATQIATLDGSAGEEPVNLEDFALMVGGQPVTSADRNFWGVTFAPSGDTFYATAASGGQTWLVEGDREARTLVAVRGNAECPSLSPDGTRVAYKTRAEGAPAGQWAIAVLDLGTNRETVLPESRSVDDQVEWLDDTTLVYGLPRPDTPGDSDIWSIPVDGRSLPERVVEHAWSPAVLRPSGS